MSNYKNGRLPKTAYQQLLSKRKSEKSCHKKKLGPKSDDSELKFSRDKENNVRCAGCKMILIPKTVPKTEFNNYINRLQLMGGSFNCCYDCKFSWYCNKCTFTWTNSKKIYGRYTGFKTCPNTFIETLKNFNYGGGRYSTLELEEKKVLREYFDLELKLNRSLRGQYVDAAFIVEIFNSNQKNNFYLKCFKYYKQAVRKIIAKIKRTDTSITGLTSGEYDKFIAYHDDIEDEYNKILKSAHPNLFEDSDETEESEYTTESEVESELETKLEIQAKPDPKSNSDSDFIPIPISKFDLDNHFNNIIETAKNEPDSELEDYLV